MNAKLMFVHALSPLHSGCGQGVGTIDLPITREKATGFPYLPGSSLKGVLRATCRDDQMRRIIFGPDTTSAAAHAGAVQFSDQRLVLMPIRSLTGTFAWVISPYVLKLLVRDWLFVNPNAALPKVPVLEGKECLVPEGSSLISNKGRLVLDEIDLVPQEKDNKSAQQWAKWLSERIFQDDAEWQKVFVEHFIIIHDDVMSFFSDNATEVIARTRLDDTSKTVTDRGLWYEEALPAESILAGLIVANPVTREKNSEELLNAVEKLAQQPLQLGGNATVGRGLCRLSVASGEEGN